VLEAMAEGFNLLKHTNLQRPNNIFGTGAAALASFVSTNARGNPRRMQFGLRLKFLSVVSKMKGRAFASRDAIQYAAAALSAWPMILGNSSNSGLTTKPCVLQSESAITRS
jgi:hypothetical protein